MLHSTVMVYVKMVQSERLPFMYFEDTYSQGLIL